VTLKTIAERLGVSRMTVSNAFSRPDQLSPALRRQILQTAEELGYVGPDPTARALARGSTGAVGVLLTESLTDAFTDEVATGFLAAVAAEFGPTGLALTLLTTSSGPVIPARDVALDGAIVYSCVPQSPALDWLLRRRLPLVFVDQVPRENIPSVNIDDRGGARAAARHLVELGHRRIGIVSSSVSGPYGLLADPVDAAVGRVSGERVLGWTDELGAAGIEPTVVVARAHAAGDDLDPAALILDVDPRPTAVLCFSDVIARSVLDAAKERGLRVPEDLSVIGFDDAPLAARTSPALTTVRQDVDAKGRRAAAALTAEIAGYGAEGPRSPVPHLVLPTDLVVRGSTAPPPDSLP
jgi:DNA-binding LacI/PurR family transcriptional regulator